MIIDNFTLSRMINAQEELNSKFEKDWRNSVQKEEIYTAVFTEVSEFFESSPENWKWWKRKYLKNDIQNQYIEIVDVIHFGLSYIMRDFNREEILEQNSQDLNYEYSIFEALETFRNMNNINVLKSLITAMVIYAKLSQSELIRIYFEKLAINHKRVDGGYVEGNYKKIDDKGNEDNRIIKI